MARHFFTARAGGVSVNEYSSLNLALHVGDDENSVITNRKILSSLASVNQIIFMNQVHGNRVVRVSAQMIDTPEADAIITTDKSLGLVVQTADCLPILVDGGGVVGAIHVGRRGLLNGIIEKTIGLIVAQGGRDIKATIGPAICGKCYEVDEDTYKNIITEYPVGDAGFRHIDIREIASEQLRNMGCIVNNLNICTREDENYFSYRRNNVTGRQAGVISL